MAAIEYDNNRIGQKQNMTVIEQNNNNRILR